MIYEYNLTDHLGNTRITFGDADADGLAEILQENHYYPFGMAMTMSSTLAAAPPNNYLYNGKELQDELDLGWYDYGARMYDASIGRWNGVDALGEKYVAWSPYNYVMGNPLKFIDPDGKMVVDYYNQNGTKIGTDGNPNDGRIVVVTNGREAKRIDRADRAGGTTELSDVQSGVELSSAYVRGEMGKAVDRSNAPSGDDTDGGFHEEGGVFGVNSDNQEVVGNAPAGAYADPWQTDKA